MNLNYYQSMEIRRKAERRLDEWLGTFSNEDVIGKTLSLSFWFYGQEAQVYRLAAQLLSRGFEISSLNEIDEKEDEWICIAGKQILIEEQSLQRLEMQLELLSARLRCYYEGYGLI